MSKKLIIILVTTTSILGLFWFLIAKPFIHGLKNNTDHSKLLFYFENIEHPSETKQVYYTDFFGNSSGSSNHCGHVFLEIRRYPQGSETIIKNYYDKEYPDIKLGFVTSIKQCCPIEDKYYVFCDYVGTVTSEQPFFTIKNWSNRLPVYTLSYSDTGKHQADKRCH
ncbi:hypothetical protein [Aquimarina sediminis]|uniref:hypothetical protein n=1 Tax=Aquimarina sediminis TaxID=2070536 RepID=UPI000CA043DE|nr:hypothetical protein [Aquimarina sediminis]